MPEWQIAFGFVFGALFSMSAVLIGMNAAVRANVRTTQAARTDPGKALTLAFRGGSIMGLGIVAHNLLGISILAIIFGIHPGTPERVSLLVGFGFGASLASLFAQLGGGIYTKVADVGADLVGRNIVAMMIGATVPFLFSALAIRSVGRSAFKVVEEVRRQFREITGLMEGKAKPDYSRCVDIATKDSLREMILPTLVGVVAPLVVGFTLGVWALAAFLIAVKIVGAILATFMFNAGGAWDNAKKYIEDGHYGGKGTPAHAAAVGDTFGDPLKDTAGPSLHILIKMENILSIICLPLFLMYGLKW